MLAREAMTKTSQKYWVTMAEFWFRFAQHIEESEAAGSAPLIRNRAWIVTVKRLRLAWSFTVVRP